MLKLCKSTQKSINFSINYGFSLKYSKILFKTLCVQKHKISSYFPCHTYTLQACHFRYETLSLFLHSPFNSWSFVSFAGALLSYKNAVSAISLLNSVSFKVSLCKSLMNIFCVLLCSSPYMTLI